MPGINELLESLWQSYARLNPHAAAIHELLSDRGEQIVNDHIAFRTFDDARVNIDALSRTFIDLGCEAKRSYNFEAKKLNARHYEHPDGALPRVFISELRTGEFADELGATVAGLIDQMPAGALSPDAGRLWEISYADYEKLRAESEYAAWMSAFGFCANHFTVFVNALTTFDSLELLNAFLKDNGHKLNTSGGEIKGSPDQLLEQSSTLAGEVDVEFTDGVQTIPGCYYEFARRYPDENGKLFSGFIAKSADKIFESTDRR